MTREDPRSAKFDFFGFIVWCLVFSVCGLVGFMGRDLLKENEPAVNIIVTIFSILAGFIVAIIAIVGDPQLVPGESWRQGQLDKPRAMARLTKQKLLFLTYLTTLLCVFLATIFKEHPKIEEVFRVIFLGLSIFSLIHSFRLPFVLADMQEERIDNLIEARRTQVKTN